MKTQFWLPEEPTRIRRSGDFLSMLRLHLEAENPRATDGAGTIEHYGSGPCHSIPRPREGTIGRYLSSRGVAV